VDIAPKAFLTCAEPDRAALDDLDRRLRARGVRTAFDTERVVVDGLLAERALQDLGASDLVIVASTPAAAQDQVVQAHIETATSYGKPVAHYSPGHPDDLDRLLAQLYGAAVPVRREPTHLTITPGGWSITSDDDPSTFDLDLAPDHTVTGNRTAFGSTGRVQGSWQYDQDQEILTLHIEVTTGLRPQPTSIELHVTGHSGDAIIAEEVHGTASHFTYKLTRNETSAPQRQ
jgi:hypothetical protein